MGQKITNEQVEQAYRLGKDVFQKKLKRAQALEIITKQYSMSEGSAGGYIHVLRNLLEGKSYQRTLNPYAADFYLTNIRKDFSDKQFENAMNAMEMHLVYYASLPKGGRQEAIREILAKHKRSIGLSNNIVYPDEIEIQKLYKEGTSKIVQINAYERDPRAREKCIEIYKPICSVCEFDFSKFYGDIGVGFIHVHHLVDIATIKKEYQVCPEKDLRPVCPNCHAMLHKEKPAMDIQKLKSIIALQKSS